MGNNGEKFVRKYSYTEYHYRKLCELEGKYDGELLSIPNKDGIYCCYKGIPFAKMKENKLEPFSDKGGIEMSILSGIIKGYPDIDSAVKAYKALKRQSQI